MEIHFFMKKGALFSRDFDSHQIRILGVGAIKCLWGNSTFALHDKMNKVAILSFYNMKFKVEPSVYPSYDDPLLKHLCVYSVYSGLKWVLVCLVFLLNQTNNYFKGVDHYKWMRGLVTISFNIFHAV